MTDDYKRYVPPHRRDINDESQQLGNDSDDPHFRQDHRLHYPNYHQHSRQDYRPLYPNYRQQNQANYRPQFNQYRRGSNNPQPNRRGNRPGNRPTQRPNQPFPQKRFEYTDEEFVATFKSSKTDYEEKDFPADLIEHDKPQSGLLHTFKFPFVFNEEKLRGLVRWFRNTGRNDTQAVLEFPSTLTKEHRREIHVLADDFGLGTSSQGFGEMRFISVYTEETASHGDIGKIALTEDEKKKSKDIWFLVHKLGGDYSKFSHNEIDEMIIAGKLDPKLQELLDKNQDLLAREFESKCNVDESI